MCERLRVRTGGGAAGKPVGSPAGGGRGWWFVAGPPKDRLLPNGSACVAPPEAGDAEVVARRCCGVLWALR